MIYLDTYILQQDMRIRMPKSILTNANVEKGKTLFDIYFEPDSKSIILKPRQNNEVIVKDDNT